MSNQYCVYVLQSIGNPERHYCGITSDVGQRVDRHTAGRTFHTDKYRPWRLSVTIAFDDLERAIRFEKYLKSGLDQRSVADTSSGSAILA